MLRFMRARLKGVLPKGLFGRSLLIIITPIILLQAVITYVFFERQFEDVTRRLAESIAGEISMTVEAFRAFPGEEDVIADLVRETMGIEVTWQEGERLPPVPRTAFYDIISKTLTRALEDALRRPLVLDSSSDPKVVDIHVQMPGGVLHVLAPRGRFISGKWHFLLVWMVSASVILTTISILFLRNQIRPIRNLAQAAEEFGKGIEPVEFRPAGATEVRRAGNAFLEMSARIRRHVDQRTAMLAGVGHDLRTPLTRLKLSLAVLDPNEEIDEMRKDVAEMEQMLEEYLAFARGSHGEASELIDVGELAQDVVAGARRNGAEVDLKTALNGAASLTARVRPQALRRCLANLVANATTYGYLATVTVAAKAHELQITVEDDGPGIAKKDRDEVFRPFNRLDPARNMNKAGVGLGLTIAQDAAHAHGGRIVLDDSELGGLKATLVLPI